MTCVLANITETSQIRLVHMVWCFVSFAFGKYYDLCAVIMKFLCC
jgi:hypothetical protein